MQNCSYTQEYNIISLIIDLYADLLRHLSLFSHILRQTKTFWSWHLINFFEQFVQVCQQFVWSVYIKRTRISSRINRSVAAARR